MERLITQKRLVHCMFHWEHCLFPSGMHVVLTGNRVVFHLEMLCVLNENVPLGHFINSYTRWEYQPFTIWTATRTVPIGGKRTHCVPKWNRNIPSFKTLPQCVVLSWSSLWLSSIVCTVRQCICLLVHWSVSAWKSDCIITTYLLLNLLFCFEAVLCMVVLCCLYWLSSLSSIVCTVCQCICLLVHWSVSAWKSDCIITTYLLYNLLFCLEAVLCRVVWTCLYCLSVYLFVGALIC